MSLRRILSLDDFEKAAERYLPGPVYAYVNGGVEDNVSRTANRAQFDDYAFVPRMLVRVANRTLETKLFDKAYSYPFGIAPIGMSALYAYRGDLVMARAAKQANAAMVMSGSSLIRLEDVAAEAPDAWFQVYLPGNRDQIKALVERVAAAGYRNLVFTVDCPVPANRENNVRAGFSAPLRPSWRLFWGGVSHPRWTFGSFLRTLVSHGMPHFENNFATRGAPILSKDVLRDFSDRGNLDWDDWDFVRRIWKGRLIIKGILHREDAKIARERGADAVWVSNHGGRQLDGAITPLRVLPEIVEAVPDIPVMVDSGFRRGTDVLKALALGAKFVWLGRPFGYAASVGGEEGVRHAINILAHEVKTSMAMLGINSAGEMRPEHLRRAC
ncbi:MAG TPA: alpha-hydroxy acid oxidase [Usitatibacter sp.]|nr:alpha-hydroxy acid oxidase [Usitatibacter sp.]